MILHPKEPLQALTQHDLVKELQSSYSDVCEALSMVQLALGFLAMTGGEPLMQLGTYLKEVLQMILGPHIYKVGHEHRLSSLYVCAVLLCHHHWS